MIHIPKLLPIAGLALLAISTCSLARGDGPEPTLSVTVKAGRYDREHTPMRFEVAEDRLGPAVRMALDSGPVSLLTLMKPPEPDSFVHVGLAQVVRDGGGGRAIVSFVSLPVKKDREIHYRFFVGEPLEPRKTSTTRGLIADFAYGKLEPFQFKASDNGALELQEGNRSVFRYNASPVSSPNYKEIQNRDAYIHPAYSPSGALITGDFSSWHPHHRGFFLAYERTKTGDLTPDFWNIHVGNGKIHADGFDKPVVGPVTARFSARHRWEAKDKATGKSVVVLRERWDVEAYAIPNSPYWLFDITSTQQAVDRPLEVLPYRYGGMAYRGPEPFVKGKLDVLTSEGLHRRDGDQKPARWVDLTGPIADGSDQYAGAMIIDHPSNPHYPNVARIHPTTLPFFCYVPAHDKPLTIAVDAPTVFRYRVMIHDGHPDPKLNESLAVDFAEPPVVVVESP